MFKYKDVIDGLKSLAQAHKKSTGISHCQVLEALARKAGFQSYHHLDKTLRHEPEDSLASISLRLMRRICASKLPKHNVAYYEFVSLTKGGLGYYSHWIGWDKDGDEVRVPRPLDGVSSVKGMRKATGALFM